MWLVDYNPTDILRSDSIRKTSEAAAGAGENGLIGSIQLVDVSTDGTGPAGVSWVHENDFNPCHPGFVRDELSQLIERPRGELASLRPSSPNPGAYVLQILQGNPSPGAFGLRNQSLGNGMVDIASEAAFLSLALLEEPFGRFGPLLLERGPEFSMPLTQAVQVPAGERFSIRINGNIDDAQINPQEILGVSGRGFVHLTDGIQEEAAVVVDEIGFSLAGLEKLSLSLSSQEWNFHSTGCSPDGDLIGIVAQDPVIVGDGAVGPELPLCLPVELIGIGHFGVAADDYLSGEREALPHVMVGEFVEVKLTKGLAIPGYLRDIIASSIGLLHRIKKGLSLPWRRLKFDISHKFHRLQSNTFNLVCQV